jgi:acyl-CoA reductase-like NAD-dependent aldehyde dehydrogenase
MPSHIELMIPGAATSGQPLEVTAPYDNTLLATVETAAAAAVEQALATAHAL